MNTFKVGDRVEVHGMDVYQQYNGLRGTVTGEPPKYLNDKVAIKPDSNSSFTHHSSLVFPPHNLRLLCTQEDVDLVNKLNAPVFKAGDRVRVIKNCGSSIYNDTIGKTGVVWRIKAPEDTAGGFNLNVELETGERTINFKSEELELLSHSSPQQQTNKPKEDPMKPYAVIYHDLSTTQAALQSAHATEAEAKEAAERLAAENRSQVTKRVFFTITILNTKTGELIGSVTDAPPAVDWKNQCLPS